MLQPQFFKVVCKKLYPFVAVASKMHAPHLQSMLLDKLKISLLGMLLLEEYPMETSSRAQKSAARCAL